MSSFDTLGQVHKIFPTEAKTDSFRVRNFVLKLEGQYPQLIKFQMTQDRCDMLDNFNEGDMLKVHFDLRGREWNGKYLTNLNAWRLEKAEENKQEESNENDNFPSFEPVTTEKTEQNRAEDFDDLPF